MRQNLPITQTEFQMEDGETLVSTTDLSSYITYCNPAFIRVSGYSKEELLGQPHNMVRHPDMPEEAFRDMWTTIKSGQTWVGLVKNRRKNGDHYWVQANVTPIMRDGTQTGYMSVRTKPNRAQIEQAEQLYARMREEKARGAMTVALAQGRLVRTGWMGAMQRAMQLGVGGRIQVSLLALGLGAAMLSRLGFMQTGAGSLLVWPVVAGVAIALGWWLKQAVTRPIVDAVKVANRIAAGDLTQTVSTTRSDELGLLMRALNQLNVNLQGIVSDVRREVDGIGGASKDVATGSQDLSQRTESQASNLQQTAAAIEELESTVRQNADAARQADQLAGQASEVATRGGVTMGEVASTMQDISQASGRIADIIQVIESIAFQTNILALNAAVEAARAGEQGRGFAVVASEVRALAQRTSGAAKEVKALIEDSVGKVSNGTQTVQRAGETMQAIVDSVRRVTKLISEITGATDQQAAGIGQVNKAVGELDSMTQQNAALVEQSSAAATTLQQQAMVLQESVQIFHLESRR